jgi:hypothetical protein
MAERCPSCGAELPEELGQHALALGPRLVQCPACGETTTLEGPGAPEPGDEARASGDVARSTETVGGEEGAPDSFSGEETMEGVLEELESKPGGPEAQP